MSEVLSKEAMENEAAVAQAPAKGMRFWLAMSCIMLSTFLAALDSVSGTIWEKCHVHFN